jgi:hypothetical protein
VKLRIIRIATADNIEFVFEFFVPGDALPDGVEIEIARRSNRRTALMRCLSDERDRRADIP